MHEAHHLPGKPASRTSAIFLGDIKAVQLTKRPHERRLQSLLRKHDHLGRLQPGGERMLCATVAPTGRWLAVLVFHAAAKHLKPRDKWIGGTPARMTAAGAPSPTTAACSSGPKATNPASDRGCSAGRWIADAPPLKTHLSASGICWEPAVSRSRCFKIALAGRPRPGFSCCVL